MRHVDLAAHLKQVRCADQALRDVVDGAGIIGDVLADRAVATGRRGDQPAALVAQRQRQPVDLGLGGIGQRGLRPEAEELAHRGVEVGDALVVEGVLERQHRHRVAQLGEALGGPCADLQRGAVGAHQMREPGLDRLVAAFQAVIVGVGNLGRIGAVIERIGMGDLGGQPRQFCPGLRFGQRLDADVVRHRSAPRWSQAQVIGRVSGEVQSQAVLRGAALRRRMSRLLPSVRRRPPGVDCPSRRPAGRAAHSHGPRRFRYSSRRPSRC